MRKISYYVIAVVVAGAALTSLWIYQRYFKPTDQAFLYFQVDRGDIQEAIRVRSEVVAQKEFELEFPFTGTVEAVYVKDSQAVSAGQRLMKLETKDLALQVSQLGAVVAQRKADLAKLAAGATVEDISVSEGKLASATVGLQEAKTNLVDKVKDAYTKSDDTVRAKTDQLFDNPRSTSPSLNTTISSGSSVRSSLSTQRLAYETVLNAWSVALTSLTTSSDILASVQIAKQNIASVSMFLDMLSPVVNNLTANASLSQTTIDAYKTDLSAARTNMSLATANLSAAEEKYNLAVANVTLYERELTLKRAPARAEDIAIAEARVRESESQLATTQEQIAKSTLVAPAAGTVSKVHYEVGEVFRLGQSAVSLSADGYKLQADVSELDIGKVRETDGNVVRIALDAFPDQPFVGRVVSVDAKEVVKTEDKYYRVNIFFDAKGVDVRSGMNADATILSVAKKDVLRVPELAVYTDGKKKYVQVLAAGLAKAKSDASLTKVDVQTGITDGDQVEIVSGVTEGQTVVVSAE